MDNSHFAKFARESGIISKRCNKTDIDLIFTRIKSRGMRRINFSQFMQGLEIIADKKQMTLYDLESRILEAGGPKTSHTQRAEYVKFHDDKTTYTGVYKRGGPAINDVYENITLSNLADRSEADVRGRKVYKSNEEHRPHRRIPGHYEESQIESQSWNNTPKALRDTTIYPRLTHSDGHRDHQDHRNPGDDYYDAPSAGYRYAQELGSYAPRDQRDLYEYDDRIFGVPPKKKLPSSSNKRRKPESNEIPIDIVETLRPRSQQVTSSQSPSVFNRLTDARLYTGHHRLRFDEQGHGRGLDGRDSVAKGRGYVPRGRKSSFIGNTNTRTDHVYNDSSEFLMRR